MTDAITRAIALIEEGAAELQLSHTLPCDRNNWTDEEDARAVFDEHVAVAVALRQLRAELDAAPDLLEALQNLERTAGIASMEDNPARVAARAAIAKATGSPT